MGCPRLPLGVCGSMLDAADACAKIMERREREEKPVRKKALGAGPFVAIALLVAAAVGVAFLIREDKTKAAAPPAAPERVPFADYPPEEPPPPRVRKEKSWREAPEGLANEPSWQEALAIARRAEGLVDEAMKAREAGDHGLYQEKGKAAKEAYDGALGMTAEWEEEIMLAYGEGNPQVRDIMSTRSRWFDKLRVLHKTTGR